MRKGPFIIYLGSNEPYVEWLAENYRSKADGAPTIVYFNPPDNPEIAIAKVNEKIKAIQNEYHLILAVVIPRRYKGMIEDLVFWSKRMGNYRLLLQKDFDMPHNPFRLIVPTATGHDFVDTVIK